MNCTPALKQACNSFGTNKAGSLKKTSAPGDHCQITDDAENTAIH